MDPNRKSRGRDAGPGKNNAPGSWNRAQHAFVMDGEQVPNKILQLNYSKLFTIGLPFIAYQSVEPLRLTHDPHIQQCSCFKDTSQQADVSCYSCYGERYIPGYFKFGHTTMWWSSVDTWTLTNATLNQAITPWRFQIADGQTSATLVSPSQVVTRPSTGPWEAFAEYALRNPPDSHNAQVVVRFTINGGPQHDINSIALVNPQPGQSIQWHVYLTRATVDTPSPLFEIVRARYPTVPAIKGFKPDTPPLGVIMILRTWEMERFSREPSGSKLETQGQRFWSIPLGFFDPSIKPDTQEAKLGIRHFLRKIGGPEAGKCYVPTPPFSYSEQLYMFTRQEFSLRGAIGTPRIIGQSVNDGETVYSVW